MYFLPEMSPGLISLTDKSIKRMMVKSKFRISITRIETNFSTTSMFDYIEKGNLAEREKEIVNVYLNLCERLNT
jgi:hypothetical protein